MYRLKELRTEFNLTVRAVDELTGINYSMYSRLELGKQNLIYSQIEILTKFFQVSSDYLLGISDSGIICQPFDKDVNVVLSKKQYDEYKQYIYINSNHKRIIGNEALEKMSLEQEQKNLAGVQGLMNAWGDDLSTEIISKLVLLTDEQKQFILTTIKMWGK